MKQHRKTAHFVHKANTIGIPSEADIANNMLTLNMSNTRSHSPAKKGFLGFKTLKNKHKSDIPISENSKEASDELTSKKDMPRRWSEANPATVT